MSKPSGPASTQTTSLVKNYVAIRDKMKEIAERHSEELKPFVDMQNELTAKLTGILEATDAQSIKTSEGTVYASTRYSASLADPKAFMDYVIENKTWELLDRKANSTACRDFVEAKGSEPPGVKLSAIRTLGVRRS